jgi:hypothetical protein
MQRSSFIFRPLERFRLIVANRFDTNILLWVHKAGDAIAGQMAHGYMKPKTAVDYLPLRILASV